MECEYALMERLYIHADLTLNSVTEGLTLQQQQARLHWWLTEIQRSKIGLDQLDALIARHLVLIARDVIGRK